MSSVFVPRPSAAGVRRDAQAATGARSQTKCTQPHTHSHTSHDIQHVLVVFLRLKSDTGMRGMHVSVCREIRAVRESFIETYGQKIEKAQDAEPRRACLRQPDDCGDRAMWCGHRQGGAMDLRYNEFPKPLQYCSA